MKRLLLLSLIPVFILAGCASLKQAKNDVAVGYTVPLANGEVSPADQARPIADVTTGVITTALPIAGPFQNPIHNAIAWAAGTFFAWQRGRNIRKNQAPSANPITGFLGNQAGLESIVQNIATVASGVTELFKEGSSAQHAWQGALTGLLGLGGTMLAIPAVHAAVIADPKIALVVAGISGLVNGIQQALTQVKPIATSTVVSSPVVAA